jgi:phospholipase C
MNKFIFFILVSVSLYASDVRSKIDHIIVVYLENRSFDNLFRGFEGADTSDRPFKPYALQSDTNGTVYRSLPMGEKAIRLGLPKEIENKPFLLDTYISQNDIIPDMVHRFFQNQLQINGGTNDRFVAYSNEQALTMGYHNIQDSALWSYAHEYTLCDRFFIAAFGGSFLNHQWLIAAQAPYVGLESKISHYELSEKGEILKDGILTPDGYAVNTIQPYNPPYKAKYNDPALRLKPLTYETIGDRLTDKNVSWSWYSGGYDEAVAGDGDDVNYQYHHNPFLYFANYAPGTEGRKHLKDEKHFFDELDNNTLPHVVFFKPSAAENQHPGYASVKAADDKLRKIVQTVREHPKIWGNAVIIITYDDNGGLWDHVAPPVVDRWGPGTRIPAIIISPFAKKGFVDHTDYDTTSILRLIEWRYNLMPLGERKSNNLLKALTL